MVIHSLTNKIYLNGGIKYSSINWRNEWYAFINLYKKEIKESDSIHNYSKDRIGYIICWFDQNILQKIGEDTDQTLNVRIRIVCGMINNLTVIPREMKIEFMECIWDTFNKLKREYTEWYCHWILQLPF